MRRKPLGDLELEVLQYVAGHGSATVRDVSESFSASHDLARTTLLTVMERLRKKGYLHRKKSNGAFVYSPAQAQGEVMQDIVKDFVERTLGGSLSPFVAYLAKEKGLTADELDKLKKLVDGMEDENAS